MKKKNKRVWKNQHAKGKADVSLPAMPWDMGAEGQANRHNLHREERGEINPATGKMENPNGVQGMRRVDMLEIWHGKGVISTRGHNAAVKLRNAFEQTQRAPGWPDNDRVQSSPKPDHAVTIQIDRISKFAAIYNLVPYRDNDIIWHCVICRGIPSSLVVRGRYPYRGKYYDVGLEYLREALDRLADQLDGNKRHALHGT